MTLFNETGLIGSYTTQLSNNVTGDTFTPILIILLFTLIFLLSVGASIEWTAIIVLPLLITGMAYTQEYFLLGGITLIYLGILMAKQYITNR